MPSTSRSARSFGAPAFAGDGRGHALGREPRAMQRLADVNVAEPGDDALVQQRRLQARLLALAGPRQHRGVEGVAERLGAEPVEQRLGIELCARHDLHRAEAARIVEGHDRARRHVKDHVIVGRMLRAFVIDSGRAPCRRPSAKHVKRAGHAEMHEQHIAGREIGEQIFRPSAEAGHGLALEAWRKILRQRPAQIAAVNLDLGEARALHRRLEAAAHRLDFGKFGHRSTGRGARQWLILPDIASLAPPRYGLAQQES